MSKIIRCTLDNIPPLTDEQEAGFRALSEMPDSEIDYSDIPPLTDEQLAQFRPRSHWEEAGRLPRLNRDDKPTKGEVSLDSDVLEWIKRERIDPSAILREAMLRERRQSYRH